MKPFYQPKVIAFGLFAALLGSLSSSAARAGTIFETNIGDGTVGAYITAGTIECRADLGAERANRHCGVGLDLFVANATTGTIGEYTTSGTLGERRADHGVRTTHPASRYRARSVRREREQQWHDRRIHHRGASEPTLISGEHPRSIAVVGGDRSS
jgi:hypothetical protein